MKFDDNNSGVCMRTFHFFLITIVQLSTKIYSPSIASISVGRSSVFDDVRLCIT